MLHVQMIVNRALDWEATRMKGSEHSESWCRASSHGGALVGNQNF